jgi:rhodanese-related sulfurtransferase
VVSAVLGEIAVGDEMSGAPSGSRGIDDILAETRARLDRLDPVQARQAQLDGAVLVDIRPTAQRAGAGEIPGALIVERNVLEWRFDPRSDARLPVADRYDLPVVVFCQEGYTSSLAAAALQDLGLHRATDVDGGFAAWQAAGLPVSAFRSTSQM